MTSLIPNFRFSVDDEPTEDWTVEEVMHWCLLQSHEATDNKLQELIDTLNQQFEEGTRELWESHEVAASASNRTENDDPQVKEDTSASTGDKKPAPSEAIIKYIRVEVTEGPYQGQTYKLQPKVRAPCWVGRSAGKKFRERGISLANDEEVSTTHGKFELKHGKATFTDTGSTNGTFHDEVELQAQVPFELKDGMVLKMGRSVVQIALLQA